jgi:crotonobetainyl-CoA:carnitine CoA-transferase CaiB-like acyl-CoA transferase
MEHMMDGVKVVELGEFVFIPSAAAVLADWGADVVKVEHPQRGDTLRGHLGIFASFGYETDDFNFLVEQANRGKRSLGLDLHHRDGKEIFLKLVAESDVLLTSLLEPAREKFGITYEELAAINPRLIYVRGHGQGQRGPAARLGGIDVAAFWARSGMGYSYTDEGELLKFQRQGFGDLTSGMFLAGGVAAALYRRSVTGQGSLVDMSLFNAAMWMMSPEIIATHYMGHLAPAPTWQGIPKNPLVGPYRTGDDRCVVLAMLTSDRYWPQFCNALDRGDLIDHPDYNTFDKRAHNEALYEVIARELASQPLAHWRDALSAAGCVFAPVQSPLEVADDPQSIANGYFPEHPTRQGAHLVASPIQFNNEPVELRAGAPEAGQQTEEILLELGFDWPDIVRLKDEGAIT